MERRTISADDVAEPDHLIFGGPAGSGEIGAWAGRPPAFGQLATVLGPQLGAEPAPTVPAPATMLPDHRPDAARVRGSSR